jgi:DNA processing protein
LVRSVSRCKVSCVTGLVTNAEDVIEELPTPGRAALVQLEAVESGQRDLLVAHGLSPTEKKIYELSSAEESRPIDGLVETSGLNLNQVVATLFTLELRGIVRQLPGKQFNRALL